MLFNSYQFLFLFLPAVLFLSWVAGKVWSRPAVYAVLIASSLVFVASSSSSSAVLLLVSMGANIAFIWLLSAARAPFARGLTLTLAILFNLSFIGFFKYYAFLVTNAALFLDIPWDPADEPELPLAISFYTFQFIALIVDVWRRSLDAPPPSDVALFSSFFPQLVAGPIVRYQQVAEQLRSIPSFDAKKIQDGSVFLCMGLFKKCVIADSLAVHANRFFDGVSAGRTPQLLEAWFGVLAYTFQIYFDFSGYSDIAVGLALLFGITLPLNFLSPYKSRSVIEFWRHWHITLSQFLRDYLYVPLGGNRKGPFRRWLNLAVTMTLGGLWHGASWNFVLWGAFHGIGLGINHAVRAIGIRTSPLIAWTLTFLFVCVGWVLFRTPDLNDAVAIYTAMLGLNGVMLPVSAAPILAMLPGMDSLITFGSSELVRLSIIPPILLATLVTFWGVRADQVVARLDEALWRKGWVGMVLGSALAFSIYAIPETTEYIYFRF